jgi:DNA adenine methylase
LFSLKDYTIQTGKKEKMTLPLFELIEIETKLAKPFLKWAGGKSQLLAQFERLYPLELKQGRIKRYIEPFIGGGAVFFEVAQKYEIESAYLYDINVELVLAYKVIQKAPEKLIERLYKLSEIYKGFTEDRRKSFFYEIRDSYNSQRANIDYQRYSENWVLRAAMLIFLNRTCFNGLFRLNSKGGFNVPHGRYANPRILDEENLIAVSRLLRNAEILAGDFELCEKAITANSFIYFDPPYRPLNKTSSFTSYSTFDFNDEQQARLADFFRGLDNKYDSKLMLSNSDPKNEALEDTFFEELYHGFYINQVFANRMINSNSSGRGQISELLITNYEVENE